MGLNTDSWQSISSGTSSETCMGQWKLWSTVLSDLRKTFAEIAVGFNITLSVCQLD